MKVKFLNLYLSILITIFAGCSSTYTLKDFSSEKIFYKDFNNSVKDKSVKVRLVNDSLYSVPNGAVIFNDTLIFIEGTKKEKIKVDNSAIKEIRNYYKTDFSHPLHRIILKNGKELSGYNIEILPDSSIEYLVQENIYGRHIPINKIREVSYKNHWLGLIPGISSGVVVGFITGILGFYPVHNSQPNMGSIGETQSTDLAGSTVIGTGLGLLIGSVVGWLIGYSYTYQFNP